MAMEAGNIVFDIKGDDTHLGKTLKGVERNFTNTSRVVGAAMTAVGAAVTGAVTSIGYASLRASADINKSALRMVASLGLPAEEAERFRELIRKVYGNNFGESLNDVGDAIQTVALALKRVGEESDDAIAQSTENAIALRDTYQVGVSESMNAVTGLMQNFGLTSAQAFDFITLGMQRGLNASGDFLDSIGEYSTQFAEGGATAAQFFSMMETGMQSGMLGTDKAADAFKEFRVRLLDGSKLTADSLAMIGLDVNKITKEINAGTFSVAEAWDLVIQYLEKTGSTAVQMQAGVGLIGTQFEDLGTKTVFAMKMGKTGLDEMAGATAGLSEQYNTLGNNIEGFRRRVILAGEALVEAISPGLNKVMDQIAPLIDRFTTWAKENEGLASTLTWVAVAIGGLMLIVGPLILALPAIGAAFGAVSTASFPLIAAVVAIGAALAGLIFYAWETIAAWDGWGALWTWVGDILATARGWFDEHFGTILDIMGNAVKGLVLMGGMLWEGLSLAFRLLWELLSRIFGEIGEGFVDLSGSAKDGSVSFLDSVQMLQERSLFILTEISKAFERFTDFIYWMWPVVSAAMEIGANLFIEPLFNMLDMVMWVAEKIAQVMQGLGGVWDWLFGGSGMAGGVSIGVPPGMATGGVVQRGGWAMVGERGPELVNLPRGATVYDHEQSKSAMAGGITMHFNISGSADPAETSRKIADTLRLELRALGIT